ncbi:GGDEF domain-containing response regulator [Leptospira kmetyi]|uniref:Diguanylate cyclase n=1 Tax=Leptospira kmetyi TaxID=408139 RepID=A0A2M9XW51_9LEPT|nr:diguanylate cyclase [Leptospira kmetyi]AYV56804.1 diguanylate cyclase [Leptospira kmetyi]PJZ31097.1 hypothetical protein CH378_04000 [Leptospira kmetyi]PJZ43527.1 hypothetical protein CH370_03670 [Leptospira kmetyi]TGK21825.1 diguanylate cyclase [Leptospira kmetyi]TGK26755.1 diguanylate cyclase [Leptospira kmetyi]
MNQYSARILIVEDESIVARDIRDRLVKMGYPFPTIARNGAEALSTASALKPDLVLMDIMLTRGKIDGVEVATELRLTMDVPVVYITAYADDQTLIRTKQTEPYGYILKPVRTLELQIAIEIALNKHTMERKLRENQQLLLTTLESIGDAVIATDESGNITFMNRISEGFTGWNISDVAGRKIQEIVKIVSYSEQNEMPDPISHILESKEQILFVSDIRLIDRFGKDRPIECTASLIQLEGGITLGAVLVFRDVTERKVTEECVRYLAYHDPLTGLPNRTSLFERFKRNIEIARPKRKEYTMSFLFIDFDDFKKVNDSMGHAAGDRLLQEFSDRMRGIVREDDIIVRLSGDEFVIILNDLANPSDAERVVRKIFSSLKKPFSIDEFTIPLSISIGISVYPKDSTDIDQLIRYADAAMYKCKLKGKNRYAFYSLESDSKVV